MTNAGPVEPRSFGLYLDNRQRQPESATYFDVTNPATGAVWARVPDASDSDVNNAVESSRRAFESGEWPTWRAADRAAFLIRFGQLIAENAEEIAQLQVDENGKLMREMYGQAKLMPEYYNYYAGLAQMPTGHTTPLHLRDIMAYTVREPVGVVAAITPWNSPLLLLTSKLGPALAAGNTVIAKPSEVTPVSAIRIAELATQAGLPPGVFNVVTGLGQSTGVSLVAHAGTDMVAFTGSTAVGRSIARSAGENLKRVVLELGGKSPNIVFDDADVDSAINGLVAGIFGASGQTCIAGSRILVQAGVYDRVVDAMRERAESITIGDPQVQATEMGTVASRAQYDKVLQYIDIATAEGAKLVAGGEAVEVAGLPAGLFIRPTIFADVTNDMSIARDEVFGPVGVVIRFEDEADAIRIANDTEFGLAAGIWTNSVQRAHRVAAALKAGTVWINNYRKTGYSVPFGGFKNSGLGRENGPDALHEYTEQKSVWVDTGLGVKDPFNPRA